MDLIVGQQTSRYFLRKATYRITWNSGHITFNFHHFQASPSLLFTVIFMWFAGEIYCNILPNIFAGEIYGVTIYWHNLHKQATTCTRPLVGLGQSLRQSVQFHYSPPNTPVNGTCVYRLLWWWNYGCRDNVALVNGRGMGWARLEWQVGLAEW